MDVVDKAGQVYVFGSGDCGQLGLGEEILSRKRPTLHPYFSDKFIIKIDAGGLHNLALSSSGEVYSWGCNDEKALGHYGPDMGVEKVIGLENEKIVMIGCGDSISAALTEKGQMYTWGTFRDSKGVIGFNVGSTVQEKPTVLSSLTLYKVTQIAVGANHCVALTSDHQVFTWGCGEQGQLGRRVLERHKAKGLLPVNITPRARPKPIFTHVTCGSYHTLALTTNGKIYAWGLNNYGQLGLNDKEERLLPEALDIPEDIVFTQLAAGEHHSIGLTTEGKVYGWGRADSGQLCQASKEYTLVPLLLSDFPSGCQIVQIASGGNHCLALDARNQIYSWGFGGMYQLGTGKEDDICIPFRIDFNCGKVFSIKGGGQHSLMLVSGG